ncbi:SpoIID/LytB domain-containing protein [Stygiobacter electus]|uniref:SpoIID/LytB domain-containing protein n=1 Tax=Stygiobacter electus TaxID=3032292 RepID=A0AAE3P1J6_9BACT|nr:SpoIID/LytB domain-containing protein [Stygiobacter electus]MDF1612037.1 SpoIID/LytB domain-containing protein [Stygiobacter electus]
MKKYFLLILLLISDTIFSQPKFEKEPIIRIRIINTLDSLNIIFNDDWKEKNRSKNFSSKEETTFFIENNEIKAMHNDEIVSLGDEVILINESNGTLKIKNVPFGVGWWWQNKEDRIYEGEIHLYITKENKFEVVIHLPLEQYLKGVVPYEIGNDSPLEALKAQAVAARSEAIMALQSKIFSGEHYDLTSDVECQVFSGNEKRNSLTDKAVNETYGLILAENENPINAYYSSNCGGHSELIKNVWGDRPNPESYNKTHFDWEDSTFLDLSLEQNIHDWILSNPPAFCNPNIHANLPNWTKNNFRWKREFTIDELSSMLSKKKDFGNLVNIKTLKRGISGRVIHAKFIFEKDSIETKGELKIRQLFSPPLKSSAFIFEKEDDKFIFYGAGWGHGIGMCQSGAITMANNNYSFIEILQHYYTKADIIKIYD